MQTNEMGARLKQLKMETEKGCKSLNRAELSAEQPERSTAETEQNKMENRLDRLVKDIKERQGANVRRCRAPVTHEERERLKAYRRQRLTDASEEGREKQRARYYKFWATATDEVREKRKAYTKAYNKAYHRKRIITDEEREKKRAYQRNRRAMATDEEREKLKAYKRNRLIGFTVEEREMHNARKRELHANSTVEQMEKRKAYNCKYRVKYMSKKRDKENASSEEKNAKPKDEQKEKRKMNILDSCAKATAEEYEADPQFLVKIEQGDINNASYLGSECIKPSDIAGEQCETSSTTKVDQCTSQIGPLDYFEVCEDWRARVKIEYDEED